MTIDLTAEPRDTEARSDRLRRAGINFNQLAATWQRTRGLVPTGQAIQLERGVTGPEVYRARDGVTTQRPDDAPDFTDVGLAASRLAAPVLQSVLQLPLWQRTLANVAIAGGAAMVPEAIPSLMAPGGLMASGLMAGDLDSNLGRAPVPRLDAKLFAPEGRGPLTHRQVLGLEPPGSTSPYGNEGVLDRPQTLSEQANRNIADLLFTATNPADPLNSGPLEVLGVIQGLARTAAAGGRLAEAARKSLSVLPDDLVEDAVRGLSREMNPGAVADVRARVAREERQQQRFTQALDQAEEVGWDALGRRQNQFDKINETRAIGQQTRKGLNEVEQAFARARERQRVNAPLMAEMADYARTRQTAAQIRQAQAAAKQAELDRQVAQLEHLGDMSAENLRGNLRARAGVPGLAQAEQRVADQADVVARFRELEQDAPPGLLDQLLAERAGLKTAEDLFWQRRQGVNLPVDDLVEGELAAARQTQQQAQDLLGQRRRNLADLATQERLQAFQQGRRAESLPASDLELPGQVPPARLASGLEVVSEGPRGVRSRTVLGEDSADSLEGIFARARARQGLPADTPPESFAARQAEIPTARPGLLEPERTPATSSGELEQVFVRARQRQGLDPGDAPLTPGRTISPARQLADEAYTPTAPAYRPVELKGVREGSLGRSVDQVEAPSVTREIAERELRDARQLLDDYPEAPPSLARKLRRRVEEAEDQLEQLGRLDPAPAPRAADVTAAEPPAQAFDDWDHAVSDLQHSLQDRARRLAGERSAAAADQVEAFARRADELAQTVHPRTARRQALEELFERRGHESALEPREPARRRSLAGFDFDPEDAGAGARAAQLDQAAATPGRPPAVPYTVAGEPVQLGRLQAVKRVSIPAMVRLVRELTGQVPSINEGLQKLGKKMGGTIRGRVLKGQIELNPKIFEDVDQASQTLAHEIGHLPTLVQGAHKSDTVAGQVAVLRKQLRHLVDRETRAELEALSREWRPLDESKVGKDFLRYRNQPDELVADAISVLLNDAELLHQRAPKFFERFLAHLDQKPAAQEALVGLYRWMSGTATDITTDLSHDIQTGILRGEQVLEAMRQEKEARESSTFERLRQQFLDGTRFQFSDKGGEFKRRAQRLDDAGESIPEHLDPRVTFDEFNFSGNRNRRLFEDFHDQVETVLREAGVSETDAGEYMIALRIAEGDRMKLANPYGLTPVEARELIARTRAREDFNTIDRATRSVRDLHWRTVENAHEAGLITDEMFEHLAKNRDTYATFAVVDHLQDQIPAAIKAQSGTFKEVANPLTAMLMKSVSLNNAAEFNRAKKQILDFMERYHPDELTPAPASGPGQQRRLPHGKKEFEVFVGGESKTFHVDPYVAETFEKTPYGQLSFLARVATFVDRGWLKPLWLTYNAVFQAQNFKRDFDRTVRSLTALGAFKKLSPVNTLRLARDYANALKPAWDYARGNRNPLIQQMLDELAIVPPWETQIGLLDGESHLNYLLRRAGVSAAPTKQRTPILGALTSAWDFYKDVSKLIEIVPKVAGYRRLEQMANISTRQRAHLVRTHIGTPNYLIRGQATEVSNRLFMFSNIFIQGWKSELTMVSRPSTRAGYALEMMKQLTPKLVMAAGAAGLFGYEVQQAYRGIPEYEKTQHVVVPMGLVNKAGEAIGSVTGLDLPRFEEYDNAAERPRVNYVRLPMDETSRLLGGMLWKLATAGESQKDFEDWFSDVLLYGQGQLGLDLSGSVKIGKVLLDVATGVNPIDDFKGRPVVPRTEFEAGGASRWKGALRWVLDQGGMPGKQLNTWVLREDSSTPVLTWLPANIPLVNAFFRTSGYGYVEEERQIEANERKQKAKDKLALGENTRAVLGSYSRLRNVKQRQPNQEEAWGYAKQFQAVYRQVDERIHELEEDDSLPDAKREAEISKLRSELEWEARDYVKEIDPLMGRSGRQ